MSFRISPLWWPFLAGTSPLVALFLFGKNRRYRANLIKVAARNQDRLRQAEPIDLPELDFLELTVLVEDHGRRSHRHHHGAQQHQSAKGFPVGPRQLRPFFIAHATGV